MKVRLESVFDSLKSLCLYCIGLLLFASSGPVLAQTTESLLPVTGNAILTMAEAVELGLANDEELEKTRELLKGAEAGLEEAKSERLPDFGLAGRYTRNLMLPAFFIDMGEGLQKLEIGADNDVFGALAGTWNLWTSGRVSSGIGAAREAMVATEFRQLAVEYYVRFKVKSAYFAAQLAAESVRIASKAFEDAEEFARIANAEYREGTSSRFDLMRAEVEVANRRPQVIVAENDLEQALMLLKKVCGLKFDEPLVLADSFENVSIPEDVVSLVSSAIGANPQLQALEHLVASRRELLHLEKAGDNPILQLSGNYSVQGQWSEDITPPSDNLVDSSAISLGISVPLFDGHRTRARTSRAEADLRVSELNLLEALRQKELEIRQAHLALVSAVAALEGREDAVELALETRRLAQVRQKNGMATPLEVLDADLAFIKAEGQLAGARYAGNIAFAALEYSVGVALSSIPDQN